MSKSLPGPLPAINLNVTEDVSPPQEPGFLRLRRRRLIAHYPDGTSSEPFVYDSIDRKALDAVVILAHFEAASVVHIYLRSALRPPLLFRNGASPGLWELPAGLIEPSEQSPSGILKAAQRELREELGFDVDLDAFSSLGTPGFPAPAILAERHYFLAVRIDPNQRGEPSLDGSPLEYGGKVIHLPLTEALERCRHGDFEDEKTELGLRRLGDRLLP